MINWTGSRSTSLKEQGGGGGESKKKPSRQDRVVNYDHGTILFKAIEERQWKSTLSRMTMCPHEVSTYVYR